MFQDSISMIVKNDIVDTLSNATINGFQINLDPANPNVFEVSIQGTLENSELIGITDPVLDGKTVSYMKYIAYDENKDVIHSTTVSFSPRSKEVRDTNKKALSLLQRHCNKQNN